MKLILLSVLLEILLVMVIAVPMPDSDDDDDDSGNKTTAEPSSEPENNAMSMNHANILTLFVSFIAFMLFR